MSVVTMALAIVRSKELRQEQRQILPFEILKTKITRNDGKLGELPVGKVVTVGEGEGFLHVEVDISLSIQAIAKDSRPGVLLVGHFVLLP